MPNASAKLPRGEVVKLLRRAGVNNELVEEVTSQLPDPVDLDRDGGLLQRYGLTRDGITSMMGGSP